MAGMHRVSGCDNRIVLNFRGFTANIRATLDAGFHSLSSASDFR